MFRVVSLIYVWDRLMWVSGSEFVLCVGTFGVGFGGVCMCCVWESLGLFFRIEFVLRVVEFCVDLGE